MVVLSRFKLVPSEQKNAGYVRWITLTNMYLLQVPV
jgi:hypothetical protein